MNGAAACLRALKREGVETVFGYPGGAIMPVYDALLDSPIRHYLTRHEQGAVFAADGYARVSGRVGVCIATSGPGATNLLTGIANAHLDSVPLVLITGQVGRPLMGSDAFQEVDILGMSLPVVKHSFIPSTVEEIEPMVREACRIAAEGRPGPVLVDLPKDLQLAEEVTSATAEVEVPTMHGLRRPKEPELEAARELLREATKPVIYAGGGIGIADAVEAFRAFAEHYGAPVVSTLKGLGSLPGDHPQHLGMLGMHGWPEANAAAQECDLLIVVGARLDDRATGKLDTFAPHARLLHLDVDPAELGKLRRPTVSLAADLVPSLHGLRERFAHPEWLATCRSRRSSNRPPAVGALDPVGLMQEIARRLPGETSVTCDVGQHQMWVAQHFVFDHPRRHLTSGGLGAMGYGIPAGIGALLARPNAPALTVTGDGSILMNVQELATLNRYDLPLKILLLDNSRLGMVRQWQELFSSERFSEVDLSDNPDFVEVARSFGIGARRIEWDTEVPEALDELFRSDGPFLLHACIDPQEKVWPIVPAGASNADMLTGEER